jgi:hypothetical protein
MSTPLPNVPNVVEVAIQWRIDEDGNALTRLHYQYAGTPDANALLNMANSIANSFYGTTALGGVMSSHVTIGNVTLTDLGHDLRPQGIGYKAGATGNRAGGYLPASNCVVMNYKIGRRYRGGKPRSYFPWGTQTDLADAQTWTQSAYTAFVNAFTGIDTAIKGATSAGVSLTQQVNVSYYKGGIWQPGTSGGKPKWVPALRQGGPQVDPILGATPSLRPGSQRRRMMRG